MTTYRDDYRDIEAVLIRYASVLDGKRYEDLRDVFTPEATVNYVGLAECKCLGSIIKLVSGALDRCGPTQHLLSNMQIGVQGDRAAASCYLQAIHVGIGDHAGKVFTVWGQYQDRLVRTAIGWRIDYRQLTTLHTQGDIGLF